GPEIGVAATKTYTSQLVQMIFLAMHLGKVRGALSPQRVQELQDGALRLPEQAARVLKASAGVAEIAARSSSLGHRFMYIGRRYNLPTAFEGALKMKEISYLHAEGYAAGEMKHGPLALIEPGWMCVAAAPKSRVTDKVVSNIQEIRARGASVFAVATEGDPEIRRVSNDVVEIPECEEIFSPVLTVLPLQLLAYHAARALKLDVDRPRNLAKSVTVE
ncbi:MAG TPA: SIS domain-containing protein, partial [Planctomycetota bacterium]|nr:SIS domain-containing protein [Planctomycetota bacterium]